MMSPIETEFLLRGGERPLDVPHHQESTGKLVFQCLKDKEESNVAIVRNLIKFLCQLCLICMFIIMLFFSKTDKFMFCAKFYNFITHNAFKWHKNIQNLFDIVTYIPTYA